MRLLLVVATGVVAVCAAAASAFGSYGSARPAARPHAKVAHASVAARLRPHGTVVILGHTTGAPAGGLLGPHRRTGELLAPGPKPAPH